MNIKKLHHFKVTKYEAKVVSHGSCEYLPTGQNLAQKQQCVQQNHICIKKIPTMHSYPYRYPDMVVRSMFHQTMYMVCLMGHGSIVTTYITPW